MVRTHKFRLSFRNKGVYNIPIFPSALFIHWNSLSYLHYKVQNFTIRNENEGRKI